MTAGEFYCKKFEFYNTTMPDRVVIDVKTIIDLMEDYHNFFSGQPTPDLCCGVYEEPPLELKICTRCSKEFKSNIDCPVCPSCYL